MKTLKWSVSIAVAFTFFATIVKGLNIDGVADVDYGSAIVTQQLSTTALDNNLGLVGEANGSELDAAYGFVENGVLHLVLAGNINSDSPAYDKLHIFFMTQAGGDNPLGTNYNGAADFGHINRMGVGGNGQSSGSPGLTFDTGFAPNYWIGATMGSSTGATLYVNYEVICSNCFGGYLGSTVPSNAAPNNVMLNGDFGIQAAMNDTNILGVAGDIAGCFDTSSGDPGSVRTGLELLIPLSAIGSPTGPIRICAFLTDDPMATMYNQFLGTIGTNDTSYCSGGLGDSAAVVLTNLPGQHYFTIPVPADPCNGLLVNTTPGFDPNPISAAYDPTGGVGVVYVTLSGSCSWTATSGAPWLTITSAASGSGSGSFTYSVSSNNSVDARTGTLTIGDAILTQKVSIVESGVILPPFSDIIVDGTRDSSYGCPVAVQQLGTGFGNNIQTNLQNNAGGSELDAAYGLIKGNVLYLLLAGNLENNNNGISIFFMTQPGGLNILTNNQSTALGHNILNQMGSYAAGAHSNAPGLTFDAGFAPNYWIGVNGGQSPYHFYVDYAQLWPGSTNALGVVTNGYYLGSTTSTNGTLAGGSTANPYGIPNPFLVQATINNSNTNGVSGGTGSGGVGCTTNANGVLESLAAAAVTNGIELAIPLGALGSPTGSIAICTFVTSADGTYLSNQILNPIGTNDTSVIVCQTDLGNVTNTASLNLGNIPGGPHFFWVGPEMRITTVAVDASKNVNIGCVTENNTNLNYQLQRTVAPPASQITNNVIWSNIGLPSVGTGGIVTFADIKGGTNKPGILYRVRQDPNCP